MIDEIKAICATSPAYGYRRVDTELRQRGFVVDSKKVLRVMREQGLQPKRKCRLAATTDSNHDGPCRGAKAPQASLLFRLSPQHRHRLRDACAQPSLGSFIKAPSLQAR
ncbi:MAG: IS3 family transposase [Pseudomonadota bacterium]